MTDAITRLNRALDGRYRVEEEIGQGGMASVFLAEDLRHHRRVAIKVLKPELAAMVGGERFFTEIETTAGLQHPNILPLFESGEADGLLFFVMPFVDGESLRTRLDRDGPLPVGEAVAIAVAVANALDYAHRRGVIHRDVKPANILLQDGQPVLADFGIAIAVGEAGAHRLTETGLSVGTPFYMSPEQAAGDEQVGFKSDIFALGCVLYEMLVGEPPFYGKTAQAVLAKILAGGEVAPSGHRHTVPEHVDAAITRALERVPADRFESAHQFAEALGDPSFRAPGVRRGRPKPRQWSKVTTAFGALSVAAIGVAAWALSRPATNGAVQRFSVFLPPGQQVADALIGPPLAISPDGSTLVYVGQDEAGQRLWMRRLDALESTPIGGTSGGLLPTFSPDGRELAFLSGNPAPIMVMSLETDARRTVVDLAIPAGLTWAPDGFIYFVSTDLRIARVPAAGGAVEVVGPPPTPGRGHAWPVPLSSGEGLLYARGTSASDAEIVAFRYEGAQETVLARGFYPRVALGRYLLWMNAESRLLAAPFDQDGFALEAAPVIVEDSVRFGAFGGAHLALSESGTLVYRRPTAEGGATLEPVWVDRQGRVEPIDPEWTIPALPDNQSLALSPDGESLAITVRAPSNYDLWVKRLDGGPPLQFTFGGNNSRPAWTPDGSHILYAAVLGGPANLYWRAADGSGEAELLVDRSAHGRSIQEGVVSPDRASLVYRVGSGVGLDLYIRGLESDSAGRPLLAGPHDERSPAISPDGSWLAYVSNESGRDAVYVTPFPDVGAGRWLVSPEGGTEPVWGRSGGELFYRNDALELVALRYSSGPVFVPQNREVLFDTEGFVRDIHHAAYDTSPDDQRFLMMRVLGSWDDQLIWVEHWHQALRGQVEGR